jgi:hypothetical protein
VVAFPVFAEKLQKKNASSHPSSYRPAFHFDEIDFLHRRKMFAKRLAYQNGPNLS